ncbi:hypothetical protein SKAU_G00190340 [Synaphobranchus kaupii]|uniref:Galectin n=1 Tax=Synaphobranchus kaupii TaxID=118154 RepID=A0A9Q1FDV6_SYNKA|nr:hypothetical protein SKAU_G00190340 [Synaphobranchus kaupii]
MPNAPTAPGWPGHPGQPLWPGQGQIPGQPGWPSQNPPYVAPSGSLSVPYSLDLPNGIYDKMLITINGQVTLNAKMFTVDFLKGNDIAFHFNPRFNEAGNQVIVRNHKAGDRWGKEERAIQTMFPFMRGAPFEMKILCTSNDFKVAINNVQILEFKHRVPELSKINRISVYNDVILTSVRAETLP